MYFVINLANKFIFSGADLPPLIQHIIWSGRNGPLYSVDECMLSVSNGTLSDSEWL